MNDVIPRIPDFTLIRRCGRGASSEVWIGKDKHGVLRAIRILYKQESPLFHSANLGIMQFRNLSGHHPNLLDFYYAGETPECYYYVSDPADNVWDDAPENRYEPDTLHWRITSRKLSIREITEYILAILSGLQQLHDRGFAHNDLKPENILFIGKTLKLADPDLISPAGKKITGGTAGFRPEWESTGIEADLYALGKMIYCMITGNADPSDFPVLRGTALTPEILALNEISLRCCESNTRKGFHHCAQIRQEVLTLQKKFHLLKRKSFASKSIYFPGIIAVILLCLSWLLICILIYIHEYGEEEEITQYILIPCCCEQEIFFCREFPEIAP